MEVYTFSMIQTSTLVVESMLYMH